MVHTIWRVVKKARNAIALFLKLRTPLQNPIALFAKLRAPLRNPIVLFAKLRIAICDFCENCEISSKEIRKIFLTRFFCLILIFLLNFCLILNPIFLLNFLLNSVFGVFGHKMGINIRKPTDSCKNSVMPHGMPSLAMKVQADMTGHGNLSTVQHRIHQEISKCASR